MKQTRPQRQDYSQFSASKGVLSFSRSTTVTVIQPFTSNHRPRELWEITYRTKDWTELRYLQGMSKLIPAALVVSKQVHGPSQHHNNPKPAYLHIPTGLPKHLMSMQRPTIGQMINGATPTFWTTAQVCCCCTEEQIHSINTFNPNPAPHSPFINAILDHERRQSNVSYNFLY